ncbi:MAG: adenylate/guanylate cyclase domain-containing protein [Alphaproteobacteria bacterium]
MADPKHLKDIFGSITGKSLTEDLMGKGAAESFIGKSVGESFMGKSVGESFMGKSVGESFMGKSVGESFMGKRAAEILKEMNIIGNQGKMVGFTEALRKSCSYESMNVTNSLGMKDYVMHSIDDMSSAIPLHHPPPTYYGFPGYPPYRPDSNIRDAVVIRYEDGITGTELTTLSGLIGALRELSGKGVVLELESITTGPGGTTVKIAVKSLGDTSLEEIQKKAKQLQSTQKKLIIEKGRADSYEERIKNMLLEAEMAKPIKPAVAPGERYIHVLFIDVTGFSKMKDAARENMLTMLRAMARPLVETCEGTLVNMEGDCVIAIFPDVNDAFRSAFNLQAHLAIEGPSSHAALASGKVTVGHNQSLGHSDIDGDAVNLAARLLSLAGAGEVLAHEDTAHDSDLGHDFEVVKTESRQLAKGTGTMEAGEPVPCCIMRAHHNNGTGVIKRMDED